MDAWREGGMVGEKDQLDIGMDRWRIGYMGTWTEWRDGGLVECGDGRTDGWTGVAGIGQRLVGGWIGRRVRPQLDERMDVYEDGWMGDGRTGQWGRRGNSNMKMHLPPPKNPPPSSLSHQDQAPEGRSPTSPGPT